MMSRVSTRPPATETNPRNRLLQAAIRLLAADGPEALQARRLAAKVGTSTMTVYTHFGGMGQLITEIRREGFLRFGRRLEQVPRGADPVGDLFALGLAYRDWALDNPQLYRLMFGLPHPAVARAARTRSPRPRLPPRTPFPKRRPRSPSWSPP